MKAIELKNVSFAYDGNDSQVLKETSFTLNYGEVTLLSGFSGEGKSTVLSLLTGIIPNIKTGKFSGEVLINNVNIFGEKMNEICRKVGIVFQNAESQIIQQIVEDEIAFGCENFGFEKNKIKYCIDSACSKMQLSLNWKTRTLSGGQKQRLITATTLATNQKILLLDEPLANLDKAGTVILMNTLCNLKKNGYAVLIVEHRLDMVMPYVDTVWSISNGKINKVKNKNEYLKNQSKYITDTSIHNSSKDIIFKLDNIGFSVKGREILKNISFDIKRGERVLLLGENGSGKTTLLRLIARLCYPTKGKMTQGLDSKYGQKAKISKDWFKKVGVVYQNPNYQLFMPTVKQEVTFGAESDEYANKIMKMFGISHIAERHPHSLSEGQKRRVSIAAVVATKPEVLLLDEPTVGQDYYGLRDMVEVLNKLHSENKNTMITITHDMRCAESLCDHAVCIENGVVSKEGGKELAYDYFNGNHA